MQNLKLQIVVAAAIIFSIQFISCSPPPVATKEPIRYVPIGDSYTAGTGALFEESWPVVLANHLKAEGFPIKLLANPARSGWTTQDAIDNELQVFESLYPNFATVLIGANDIARGVSLDDFRAHLKILIERMLTVLPKKNRLVLITIPDFFLTPAGNLLGPGLSVRINLFNRVIREEAFIRGLKIADIHSFSKKIAKDTSLISEDGLHPSAKGYALWETVIYKEASKILRENH